MILYVESSAFLVWLLSEQQSREVIRLINAAKKVVSSNLTILEAKRNLIRLEKMGKIKKADRFKLLGLIEQTVSGWHLVSVDASLFLKAEEVFPVEPVRSLDAIHLAICLDLLQIYPDLAVLSFDKRILENLTPLGLKNGLEV